MNTDCPKLEKCEMFKKFNSDNTRKYFIQMYCKDNFKTCERKKKSDSGVEVPADLLPDGNFIK